MSVLHSFAAITCPGLLSPRNGTWLGCSGNTTEFYDTVCQFGCNNGYVGSGSHIRRCQENETWSGEEFVCTSTSYLVVMLENVTLYFFSGTNTKEEIIITWDGNDAGYRRYSCAIGIFVKKEIYLQGHKGYALCCSPIVLSRERIKSLLISS